MTKFKVVGIINLILGFLQVAFGLIFLVFTLPKLTTLYSDLSVQSPALSTAYVMVAIVILLGVGNLFLGLKLFGKGVSDKYFKFGLVWVIASFILMIVFLPMASLSMLLPIYGLTSQF